MTLDPDTRRALDIARQLAAAGIPIFIAPPNPANKIGFDLPTGWQQTTPDPSVVDRWQPGWAMCMVMGHGLDLVDFDPRNGGEAAQFPYTKPKTYAVASTPSGGVHWFIKSLGIGSANGFLPGVDLKGGKPDGSSRGFAFIAPTVKPSKTTGELAPYVWIEEPDFAWNDPADNSGAELAEAIQRKIANRASIKRRAKVDESWWTEFIEQRTPQYPQAADKAIQDKLAEVRSWTPDCGRGFRETLMRASLTLGGYIGSGYLDETDARDKLEHAVSQIWGQPDEDDHKWIDDGIKDGATEPFVVQTPEQRRKESKPAQKVAQEGESRDPDPDKPWSVYTTLPPEFDPDGAKTDQEMAERLADYIYPVLRYATDGKVWVDRERDVWRTSTDDMSEWAVSTAARTMPLGDPNFPPDKKDWTPENWQAHRHNLFANSAGSSRIARKFRAITRKESHMTLRLTDLDTNPEIIWTPGSVAWDIRKSLDEPVRADYVVPSTPHLHCAAYVPDPEVETPAWDAFIETILPDPEIRAWALRLLAVGFTGLSVPILPVLFGRERSGKTSLVEFLLRILGTYGSPADSDLMSGTNSGGGHSQTLFDLMGKRLALVDEAPRSGYHAAERLKMLTGGSTITASAKGKPSVTFRPSHTIVMTSNSEPNMSDRAVYERVRMVPFDQPQEVTRKVWQDLNRRFDAEAPGIFALMLREAAGFLADPDSIAKERTPAAIREMEQTLAEDQDPVREWVESCTVPSEPGTKSRDLYRLHFARWHQSHPLYKRFSVPSETAWGRTLTEMGFETIRRKDGRYRPLSVIDGFGPGSVVPPGGGGAQIPVVPDPQRPVVSDTSPSQGDVRPGSHGTPNGETDGCRVSPKGDGFGDGFGANHTPEFSQVKGHFSTSGDGYVGFLPQLQNENSEGGLEASVYFDEGTSDKPVTRHPETEKQGLTCANTPSPQSANPSPTPEPVDNSNNRTQSATESKPKRQKLSDAEKEARDVLERVKARKAARQAEAAAKKALERQERVRAASGADIGLPALVTRDGSVAKIDLDSAAELLEPELAPGRVLTVDVETTGYPIGHRHYVLRTVQLGTAAFAIVLDAQHPEQRAFITDKLERAHALCAFSATADLAPIAYDGLADHTKMWAKMHDAIIPAKLADPTLTGSDAGSGLKQLAKTLLGDDATAPSAEEARKQVFRAAGWLENTKVDTPPERSGWAEIDPGSETMVRYAGSDVLDTAAVVSKLPKPQPEVHERERAFQRMNARVSFEGVRVDGEHVADLIETHRQQRSELAQQLRELGIDNPGSNVQVGEALVRAGAQDLPLSAKTGKPSVASDVLERVKSQGGEAGQLAETVLGWRRHEKAISAFLEPFDMMVRHGDGRARPTIYTLSADTGRTSCVRPNMQQCFDSATEILTDRGWLPFPEVTMEHRVAQWHESGVIDFVHPEGVLHERYDGPMVRIQTSGTEQVVTPNHRVYSYSSRGHLQVEEARNWLVHGSADKIVDRRMIRGGMLRGRKLSPEERTALYVAVALQADGSWRADCHKYEIGVSKPRKAARLGELLGREVPARTSCGRTRYRTLVSPELAEPWLAPGKVFNIQALLELDAVELDGFLAEVMFWDGDSTRGCTYHQHPDRATAVDAVELAALLSGRSTSRYVKRVGDGVYPTVNVHRSGVRWASRTNVEIVPSDGWVHCVTVPSGAVVTRRSGRVVVSGNCPRSGGFRACFTADPGEMIISADFSGVEIRVAAALSQDESLSRFISDEDAGLSDGLHWEVARSVWGPDAGKDKRYLAKAINFGLLYGGGPETLAKQSGVSVDTVRTVQEAFRQLAPGLTQWSNNLRLAVRNGATQYPSYSGRTIHLPPSFPHKAVNYCVQGSARELLVDAYLRWRQTKWGDRRIIPVHDEIITFVPEDEAEEATRVLLECMETSLYGVRIKAEASQPSFAWQDSV